MNKITNEDIKNIIDNTEIIRDNLRTCALYNYTELEFSVIGQTPFRDDMCICRDGSVIISPQLLFTPSNFNYSIDDLANEEELVLEARILFFNIINFNSASIRSSVLKRICTMSVRKSPIITNSSLSKPGQ